MNSFLYVIALTLFFIDRAFDSLQRYSFFPYLTMLVIYLIIYLLYVLSCIVDLLVFISWYPK